MIQFGRRPCGLFWNVGRLLGVRLVLIRWRVGIVTCFCIVLFLWDVAIWVLVNWVSTILAILVSHDVSHPATCIYRSTTIVAPTSLVYAREDPLSSIDRVKTLEHEPCRSWHDRLFPCVGTSVAPIARFIRGDGLSATPDWFNWMYYPDCLLATPYFTSDLLVLGITAFLLLHLVHKMTSNKGVDWESMHAKKGVGSSSCEVSVPSYRFVCTIRCRQVIPEEWVLFCLLFLVMLDLGLLLAMNELWMRNLGYLILLEWRLRTICYTYLS